MEQRHFPEVIQILVNKCAQVSSEDVVELNSMFRKVKYEWRDDFGLYDEMVL